MEVIDPGLRILLKREELAALRAVGLLLRFRFGVRVRESVERFLFVREGAVEEEEEGGKRSVGTLFREEAWEEVEVWLWCWELLWMSLLSKKGRESSKESDFGRGIAPFTVEASRPWGIRRATRKSMASFRPPALLRVYWRRRRSSPAGVVDCTSPLSGDPAVRSAFCSSSSFRFSKLGLLTLLELGSYRTSRSTS